MRFALTFLLVLIASPAWADLYYTYSTPDGGVVIVGAAPKADLEPLLCEPNEDGACVLTQGAYEAHVVERSIPPDAVNVQKMPEGWTPPADRTFREAWKQAANAPGIAVDMPKARKIWKERIAHAALLKRKGLDDKIMTAEAKGDAKAKTDAEAEKRKLSAVVPGAEIDVAATPEDLIAIWPIELGPHKR